MELNIIKKLCTSCNEILDISKFGIRVSTKDGYRNDCKLCRKRFYPNKNNKYKRFRNLDYDKQYNKEYWSKNKDILNSKRDKDRSNELSRISYKRRINNDTLFKLKRNIMCSITTSFSRNGYNKKSRTSEILGCSFDEFKLYIESKFEPWMSWDNRGLYNGTLNYGWDIDHIIPHSSAKDENELIKLNHYSNLQPLCSKVNRDIKKDFILNGYKLEANS